MKKEKNGEIELFRFIFAQCILFVHTIKYTGYFRDGWIGVEFFFIVTGILLAKTVKDKNIAINDIPDFSFNFIKRKIASFYPQYIIILFVFLIYRIFISEHTIRNVILKCLGFVPNLFFLESSGVRCVEMYYRGSWYLSSMVISLCILLPILLLNYKWAANIIFPVGGILGLGVIYENHVTFNTSASFLLSIFSSNLSRGLFEIALGVWGYEIATRIKEMKFTILAKVALTALKYLCFFIVILYAGFTDAPDYSHIIFIICLIACILSFSHNTYNIAYNKVTKFLGKISLSLYITHPMVYMLLGKQGSVLKIFVLCNVVAALYMLLIEYMMSKLEQVRIFGGGQSTLIPSI